MAESKFYEQKKELLKLESNFIKLKCELALKEIAAKKDLEVFKRDSEREKFENMMSFHRLKRRDKTRFMQWQDSRSVTGGGRP